jgi:hypothetical protein
LSRNKKGKVLTPYRALSIFPQLPQSKSLLYIDNTVPHQPQPQPQPSSKLSPPRAGLRVPSAATATATAIPSVPTGSATGTAGLPSGSALAESFDDTTPVGSVHRKPTTTTAATGDGAHSHSQSITPSSSYKRGLASGLNGKGGERVGLGVGVGVGVGVGGSPTLPPVHAEAKEYYGGKEMSSRARTYSNVGRWWWCRWWLLLESDRTDLIPGGNKPNPLPPSPGRRPRIRKA